MTTPHGHNRICPTRTDGVEILFAHKVTLTQCQDRQRGLYHKCYTCEHNNARGATPAAKALAPNSLGVKAERPKLSRRLASR